MSSVAAPRWQGRALRARVLVEGLPRVFALVLPRNRGAIVQVGSALAYGAIPLQSAYCGAKHALRGLTDALRTELFLCY